MLTYIVFLTDEVEKSLITVFETSQILFLKDNFDEELPTKVLKGIAHGQFTQRE